MSIWSSCSGSYTIPKYSGFSLQKYIESIYDEVVWRKITQEESECHSNTIEVDFEFVFSLDGIAAAELIDCLVKKITSLPGYVWSNIHSEIRFT